MKDCLARFYSSTLVLVSLLAVSQPVLAALPTVTITPSTCQLDEANSLADVTFFNNRAGHAAASGDVYLRCNVPNLCGTDTCNWYDRMQITYIDSTTTAGNYVRAELISAALSDGTITTGLYTVSSDDAICTDGDSSVHTCYDTDVLSLDFSANTYFVLIRLTRSSTANSETMFAIKIYDVP